MILELIDRDLQLSLRTFVKIGYPCARGSALLMRAPSVIARCKSDAPNTGTVRGGDGAAAGADTLAFAALRAASNALSEPPPEQPTLAAAILDEGGSSKQSSPACAVPMGANRRSPARMAGVLNIHRRE